MFDFHMHSQVSADSKARPEDMVAAAEAWGLREICFTDHLDCKVGRPETNVFTQEAYEEAYRDLSSDKLRIRFGMEFGMQPDNRQRFLEETGKRKYDFIIGSVHTIENKGVYREEYWRGKTRREAYTRYLEEILSCLEVHEDFHVLGHLTHPTKSPSNTGNVPYTLSEYGELTEEIFRRLIHKGIGLEVNTSGIRSSGRPLPPLEFVRQYVEMGGEIITVGSDAHKPAHVGNHIRETLKALGDLTPWIVVFEEGRPMYYKIDSLW